MNRTQIVPVFSLALGMTALALSSPSAAQTASPAPVAQDNGGSPGLQEIIVTGSYCNTPRDFRQTVATLAAGHFGKLRWFEERALSEGAGAFASIDAGSTAAAKIILRP